MQKDIIVIHTDGGSRGNPGPAACAFIAELNGKTVRKESKYLGKSTNNTAEYEGVLLATKWILKNRASLLAKEALFFLDSELVVKQLTGIYKIKKPELLSISLSILRNIKDSGIKVLFKNIPREQNKVADFLVNEELDLH